MKVPNQNCSIWINVPIFLEVPKLEVDWTPFHRTLNIWTSFFKHGTVCNLFIFWGIELNHLIFGFKQTDIEQNRTLDLLNYSVKTDSTIIFSIIEGTQTCLPFGNWPRTSYFCLRTDRHWIWFEPTLLEAPPSQIFMAMCLSCTRRKRLRPLHWHLEPQFLRPSMRLLNLLSPSSQGHEAPHPWGL